MPTQEDWETESGLPDDFDAYITKSYFGTDPVYQGGTVPLIIWELESPDYDNVPPIKSAIGKDWNILENGARVSHSKGKKRFVVTSIYGRIINRVTKELGVSMAEYGVPTEAKTWNGLGFHFVREELDYGRGILQDKGGKTVHLMPTSFLPKRQVEAPVVDADLMASLVALAKKAPSIKRFQLEALRMPGVIKDEALGSYVMDDGPNGFYAQKR